MMPYVLGAEASFWALLLVALFFAQGPAALAAMDRAWQAAREAGRGDMGTVRLAYPLSASHDTVPRLVDSLHHAYPGIALTIEVLPTPKVLLAVRDGRADVGIARAAVPMEGVRLQPLRRDPEGVLVTADHPLAREEVVELAAVARYPVVVHPALGEPIPLRLHRRPLRLPRTSAVVHRARYHVRPQPTVRRRWRGRVIGHSATVNLPKGLRWVPLAHPVTVDLALVSAAGEQTPIVQRFQQVALAHATAHEWLG